MPLLPILLGVVVVGFVIGAGLSAAGRHGSTDVAIASPTPAATIPDVTPLPATPQPSPTPTPEPSPSPSAKPRPLASPSASASPAVSSPPASPLATASVAPVASGAPSAAASESPSPAATPRPTPHAVLHTAAPPTAAPSAPPTERAAPVTPTSATPPPAIPSPAAPTVSGASTPFAQLAASVVRVYLASVARGDRASAAAELASPPSGSLPDESVVDGTTAIRNVTAHGTGDVVTVDVDLHTSAGAYAAQYTVKKSSTGAALITGQSLVKI